jgi:hypothetical protein
MKSNTWLNKLKGQESIYRGVRRRRSEGRSVEGRWKLVYIRAKINIPIDETDNIDTVML